MMEGNLWDLAIQQAKQNKGESQMHDDSAIFLVGSKNSGKTSIVSRFLDRDETPKPTVALEYKYGRRARGQNMFKDVGHIWELGGGSSLSKLMDVPIAAESINHTILFIVLDLSQPQELWYTLETLLQTAKAQLEVAINDSTDPEARKKLQKAAWERVGEDHLDKQMIDPFLIPLVIVGSKYDLFQDFDSEKRKVICKTLRFVAHTFGATLQFFSIKQEQLVTRMRSLISHHLFATSAIKSLQTESGKPLLVPAGLDSFQQIGSPPMAEKDLGRVHAKTPFDLWKLAYTGHFPQEKTMESGLLDDPAKDPQYKEHTIDILRAQKDEELERYRRMAERRARDAENNQYAA